MYLLHNTAEKGDDDVKNTFEWVGRALTEWETLESYLGLIFGIFVGASRDTEPAMRAYGSVLTFRGRADMLEAAGLAFYLISPHPSQVFFAEILKQSRGFSARRNEIAHGIVQLYFQDWRQPNIGSALGPSRHATNKQKLVPSLDQTSVTSVPSYAYTSLELLRFTRDFHLLANWVKGFHRNLRLVLKENLPTSP